MTTINVFVENTYPDYCADEVKIFKDTVKITEFFLKDKDILKNSCLNGYKFKTISFDIVLSNNEDIQRINKEYRNKDSATDVITFAIFSDSEPNERFIIDDEINLGEIIVSLDKIEEQSKDNNVSFDSELYYLISHGILHLLGYDHQTQAEYDFMVNNQNRAKAVVL